MLHNSTKKAQRGATMTEFVFAAPLVLSLGLGSVQAGLVYHGKATLNYAAFEAARAGAVNHAQLDAMQNELGFRLAPLEGGDGTASSARDAITASMVTNKIPLRTSIKIINPSTQAFDDWGTLSQEAGVRVIPNSHLRHRHDDRSNVGTNSGLNLHDANLLKIKVTHGFELKIPYVSHLLTKALARLDPANRLYYEQNQIPITSVATVRMQNEAWESEALLVAGQTPIGPAAISNNEFIATENSPGASPCVDEYGLTGHEALLSTAGYAQSSLTAGGMCSVSSSYYSSAADQIDAGVTGSDNATTEPLITPFGTGMSADKNADARHDSGDGCA